MPDIIHRTRCRVCKGAALERVIDLGRMPSANAFLSSSDLLKKEKVFPLIVYICRDCKLLQLLDSVNPGFLFTHYDYMTSVSGPLVTYFSEYGKFLRQRFIRSGNDLVVEIGGNDGVLLSSIKDSCRVLNIEPARNIAAMSRERGVDTMNEFFSAQLAAAIHDSHGTARVVTASNVVAHIDDLEDLFLGIRRLIGDTGVFIAEVHWVGNLIGDGGFDQIYHEHLSYFSLGSLISLGRRMGLQVFDAELTPMHGSLIRVFFSKNQRPRASLKRLLSLEKNAGLNSIGTFRRFAAKVDTNRSELRNVLIDLHAKGKTIVGYGAPAKGNTLLNTCRIGSDIVTFVIDSTPCKQGLFTPGGHIPVYPPEKFRETPPDYALLLAWNYADAILKKEKEYRQAGGSFIIPVPTVKIV